MLRLSGRYYRLRISARASACGFAIVWGLRLGAEVYSHGEPTDPEQYLLELVNRGRADPMAEAARVGIDLNQGLNSGTINGDPKPPLGFNANLLESARGHSDWMLEVDSFDHTGKNGLQPNNRMKAAGYPFSGNWGWGENIGWRGTSGFLSVNSFVAKVHDGLVISPLHRENIMNGAFDEIGLGVRTGLFQSGSTFNAVMITENFAYSSGTLGPCIVGVVYRDSNANHAYDPGEGISGVTVTYSGSANQAITSASGGYAFPYSGNGTMDIKFSGGGIASGSRSVTRAGKNVKADWLGTSVGPVEPLSLSGLTWSEATGLKCTLRGSATGVVVLQQSFDLRNWAVWKTVQKSAPEVSIQESSLGLRARFYRVQP
ncbi:MAG: hypothetical protein EXS36_16725 [Pedosphaera sp.]|nr:hypothetical protein [Pedosphaera sp.]